jgi:hypothetical protein
VLGGQDGSHFGASVGTAGDVNGDGYADVIVGAPNYNNPTSSEGMAFLYYGNGSRGASLQPRQKTLGAPLARLGQAQDRFIVCLRGITPFGRNDVGLEIELKRLGQNFDGTDSWRFPGYVWVIDSCLSFAIDPDNLVKPDDSHYHWRARWHYDPVTMPWMPASRWVTVPWNGWNEADFRSEETNEFQIFLPTILRNQH